MSTKKEYRAALIEEANALGLDFQTNVPSAKLQKMVDEAQGGAIGVSASDVEIPEVKVEVEVEKKDIPLTPKQAAHQARRKAVIAARRRAMKTRIVILTNRDIRDAGDTTTAHLSYENQHYSFGKNVPLDIPVEIEISGISSSTGISKGTFLPKLKYWFS